MGDSSGLPAKAVFIRQLSGPLAKEWNACKQSDSLCLYYEIDGLRRILYDLSHPDAINYRELAGDRYVPLGSMQFVPFGSVEFTQEYCKQMGIVLPPNFSYGVHPGQLDEFLLRRVTRHPYDDVANDRFIKPVKLKLFDAGKKADITNSAYHINPDVWASKFVQLGAEFRYYIHKGKILGWCRYDALNEDYPDPDHKLVEAIVSKINATSDAVPIAYSVDIGYRVDLDRYCLVEMNDFWSLGWYTYKDSQSKPITAEQYAQAVVDRWLQISTPLIP